MNPSSTSFRLIIIHDSVQEAQRLSSMLKNAGSPCRAQHIASEESFNKIIKEHRWDLVIAQSASQSLPPSVAIRNIHKFERDFAVILLTEESRNGAIVEGMKLGACDVVQVDDDQHLLLVVNRELANHQQRRSTRIAKRQLKEIERRNQKLLDNSKDGIAYIQDGMYFYANDSYAEILGHSSKEHVEFMPMMDSIDEKDHARVKEMLKKFTLQHNTANKAQLTFTALLPGGKKKKITVDLFMGEYENELCIQFICHKQDESQKLSTTEIENIKYTDLTTGLYNRAWLINQLEKTVANAATKETSNAFLYISIDHFEKKTKETMTIEETDKVLKDVAKFIKGYGNDNMKKARLSDHTFAIISDENDPEELLNNTQLLCKKVAKHFFEFNNKTLQLTLSIGISLINETITNTQDIISHARQAVDILRKNSDGNGSNIYQKDTEESGLSANILKHALEGDNFCLLFQPILSLRGENTERYEVLLRMMVDEQQISPTYFATIAEGLNLSAKIDRWVILESIKYLQRSLSESKSIQHFINLSRASLCDEGLLPWLKVAFEASNIPPQSIVLQAKEPDVIQHLTIAKTFVSQAKAMGVDFCITSFGCSTWEPLSTLDHIDMKYVKLDGSFSQELQENPENTEELQKLVTSLHDKNKITTIPLIENPNILSKLWQIGVHCIQGHCLQAPSPEMNYEFSNET